MSMCARAAHTHTHTYWLEKHIPRMLEGTMCTYFSLLSWLEQPAITNHSIKTKPLFIGRGYLPQGSHRRTNRGARASPLSREGGQKGVSPSIFGLTHISRSHQDPFSFAHTIPRYWLLTMYQSVRCFKKFIGVGTGGGIQAPPCFSSGGPPPCWKLLRDSISVSCTIIFCVISVYQSKNKLYRAFQLQEARLAAYFSHYTNLFGSLNHQALARDSWSLWLMRLQMILHWSLLKFTTCITRTLTWGSLKDNSVCCQIFWTAVLADIASKVTRVHTLANMLAAAPLASSMFSDWGIDKLVRIYLTNPVTTATGERSFSALRCIKTYLRWSTMSQQHLNNRMFFNVHKDLMDGLDLPTIARQFVDANECRRRFFGTVRSPQWHPPERLGLVLS